MKPGDVLASVTISSEVQARKFEARWEAEDCFVISVWGTNHEEEVCIALPADLARRVAACIMADNTKVVEERLDGTKE